MRVIYKYKLESIGVQKIILPVGAQILTVQMQRHELVMWAFVNTENDPVEKTIIMLGTGNPIGNDNEFMNKHRYINSVQLMEGNFVIHLFELL